MVQEKNHKESASADDPYASMDANEGENGNTTPAEKKSTGSFPVPELKTVTLETVQPKPSSVRARRKPQLMSVADIVPSVEAKLQVGQFDAAVRVPASVVQDAEHQLLEDHHSEISLDSARAIHVAAVAGVWGRNTVRKSRTGAAIQNATPTTPGMVEDHSWRLNGSFLRSSVCSSPMIPRSVVLKNAVKIPPNDQFTEELKPMQDGKTNFWIWSRYVEVASPFIYVWAAKTDVDCCQPPSVSEISKELTAYCSSCNFLRGFKPSLQQPVAVLLKDLTWARGVVVDIGGRKERPSVVVELVDLGGYHRLQISDNSARTPLIQPLDVRFAVRSARCLKARVEGFSGPGAYNEEIAELLRLMFYRVVDMELKEAIQIPLLASLVTEGTIPTLRVYGEGSDLSTPVTACVVQALHRTAHTEVHFGYVLYAAPLREPRLPAQMFDLLLVDRNNYGALEKMESDLQQVAKSRLPISRRDGDINAVFHYDVYQRCYILQFIDEKHVKVELVDFGEVFDTTVDKIVGLPDVLQTISAVVPCRIENLDQNDRFSRCRAHDWLEQIAKDFLPCAYQIRRMEGEFAVVRVWDPKNMGMIVPKTVDKMAWLDEIRQKRAGEVLNAELPATIYRVETLLYEKLILTGDLLWVKPVLGETDEFHSNLDSTFYARQDYTYMQETIQMICPGLPAMAEFPGLNTLVYALYGADNTWHRGVVSELPMNERVLVTFVDFGHEERIELKNLRLMDDEFLGVPRGSITMADVGIGSMPSNFRAQVRELMEGKTCRFEVYEVHPKLGLFTGSLSIPDPEKRGEMVKLSDEIVKRGFVPRIPTPYPNAIHDVAESVISSSVY